MVSAAVGFFLASLSAVLNGSFVVFSRMGRVRRAEVDPLVFQMWTCFGVLLSSLFCLPFLNGQPYPLLALGWGALSGGLFVVAVSFSFVSVQLLGLATAQGIWSGAAVLVSFTWGVAAGGDEVPRPGLAAVGALFIVTGVAGIALCRDLAWWAERRWRFCAPAESTSENMVGEEMETSVDRVLPPESEQTSSPHRIGVVRVAVKPRGGGDDGAFTHSSSSGSSGIGSASMKRALLLDDSFASFGHQLDRSSSDADHEEDEEDPLVLQALARQRQLYGSLCALVVGVFGGSILVPLLMAPPEMQRHELDFVPSFGLGAGLIAPLITVPYVWLAGDVSGGGNAAPLGDGSDGSLSSGPVSSGRWALRASLLPGLASGFMWNGANICSIYATASLSYSVAFPLMQGAIVVAAAWGVLAFGELSPTSARDPSPRHARTVLVVAMAIVLAGAGMMAAARNVPINAMGDGGGG